MALEFDNKEHMEWAVNFRPIYGNSMDAVRRVRSAAAAKKYCDELRDRGYKAEVISRWVKPWEVIDSETIGDYSG